MDLDRNAPAHRWPPLVALIVMLALVGLAAAQRPLAAYAPADTLITLSVNTQEQGFGDLGAALAALDWSQLGSVLQRSAALIDDGDVEEILEMFDDMGRLDQAFADIEAECEGLATPLEALMGEHFLDEALLTVSLSPFNPVPAVSAFARVNAAAQESAAALQEALARCFSDATFEQDGVDLILLGDGSDVPILITTVDDVFMVSSNPDVLRAAVRLSGGSAEANLAATDLWRASAALAPGGLGFSLDFAALANTLENVAGIMVDDADSEIVLDRALAALRTLGGTSGRLGLSAEGILFESLLAVNPDGGDSALAQLLLCRACTVGRPFLAPAEVVGVESQYLPVRELFAYMQTWLDDLGPLVGEDLELRRLLREEFGFDLDAALLDWIGNQVHTVQLAPFRPDVASLIYNPAVAYLIPVASAEQARAGLEMLGRALEPIATELLSSGSDLGAFSDLSGMPSFGGSFAVRERSYRGVDITRIQSSFNVDIGLAFVGNHLVIGSPATAVEPLIDTFEGGPNLLTNPDYLAAVAAAPTTVSALGYSNYSDSLEGVHALLEPLMQPLAALIDTGLREATGGAFSGGFDDLGGGGFADLFGLGSTPLSAGNGTIVVGGDLSPADEDNFGDYGDYYQLLDLEAGDSVMVEVTSDSFDTYLYLIDADSEQVLASDDDSPDTSRSELSFTVQPGRSYWVEVGSFGGTETGAYRLRIEVTSGDVPAVRSGPPTFAELLEALDLLPEAVAVLADHVDSAESYTRVEGDTVFSRHLTRIRW